MFLGVVVSSYGQVNTTEGGEVPGHGRVNAVDKQQREVNQKIAAGEQSGKLTESQAEALKRQENQIQSDKIQDMARHRGHLKKGEEKKLKREEEHLKKEVQQDQTH